MKSIIDTYQDIIIGVVIIVAVIEVIIVIISAFRSAGVYRTSEWGREFRTNLIFWNTTAGVSAVLIAFIIFGVWLIMRGIGA